jgi:hypothetical protein
MEDFINLRNAKQLGDFLSRSQIASMNISPESDDARIYREVKHICLEDEATPPLGQFLASIDRDGTGIAGIMQYWTLRDRVEEYQVKNNISSISWDTVNWKDEIFRYPSHNTQLVAMPQDSKIVNRHFWKTVSFYRSFVAQWHLPLFKDDGDYDKDSTLQEFDGLAKEIFNPKAYCELTGGDRHCPVYHYDPKGKGLGSVAYYKTEYCLSMHSGFGDDCNAHYFSASTRLLVSERA